jgi:hypothetical protein
MQLNPQEWIAAIFVCVVAIALLRAQWRKSAKQLTSSCGDCHKNSTIGKPKSAFRGIKINVSGQ